MTYDKNNIFAKILRGEIPSIKVYEDAHTLAFMDIMPVAKGHTLVIPKLEAQDLFDLPAAAAGPFLMATQKVAKAVKAALDAPGIMISQLNGPAAGQTIFHIHFHIIPRWHEDLSLHGRNEAETSELEAIAERIREKLK